MLVYPNRFFKSLPANFDGQFDWDFLTGCFERKIEPTDWDGVVETNGRFLVFETKEPGVQIPYGQKLALQRAVKTGLFTVFYLQGKTPDAFSHFEMWHMKDGQYLEHKMVPTADCIKKHARMWFERWDAAANYDVIIREKL